MNKIVFGLLLTGGCMFLNAMENKQKELEKLVLSIDIKDCEKGFKDLIGDDEVEAFKKLVQGGALVDKEAQDELTIRDRLYSKRYKYEKFIQVLKDNWPTEGRWIYLDGDGWVNYSVKRFDSEGEWIYLGGPIEDQ